MPPHQGRPIRPRLHTLVRPCTIQREAFGHRFQSDMSSDPFAHRDGGTLSHHRHDLEIVHQAARSRQAEAEALAGRKPVAHGLADIVDTRPPILCDNRYAAPASIRRYCQHHFAAASVTYDISGDLRYRGGDQYHVAAVEPDLLRELAA